MIDFFADPRSCLPARLEDWCGEHCFKPFQSRPQHIPFSTSCNSQQNECSLRARCISWSSKLQRQGGDKGLKMQNRLWRTTTQTQSERARLFQEHPKCPIEIKAAGRRKYFGCFYREKITWNSFFSMFYGAFHCSWKTGKADQRTGNFSIKTAKICSVTAILLMIETRTVRSIHDIKGSTHLLR